VVVEARAKLNLGLAVGPRRSDGYHDLATVFQSISLADTLEIVPRPRGFRLRIEYEDAAFRAGARSRGGPRSARRRRAGPGRSAAPAGSRNLVLRAAAALAADARLGRGASFRLVKRIPAGAGLGGGSADAAAALAGLARLYGLRPPRARLAALAARLGADVPFALAGGTRVGLGTGEILHRARLARPFRALVALPGWRVATPTAFARLDRLKYGLTEWGKKLGFAQHVGGKRITPEEAVQIGNSFELVLGRRRASFDSICRHLEEAGAHDPRLTGSGSAVFGILAMGDSAAEVAARYRGDETLFLVRSMSAGLRVTTPQALRTR
jgi:4-diphosphocytidyl-2-C-methyl-D-erythritol kinase